MKKIKKLFGLLVFVSLLLVGCVDGVDSISIKNGNTYTLVVGETLKLEYLKTSGIIDEVIWTSSDECVTVDSNGLVTAKLVGFSVVSVTSGTYKDEIKITVVEEKKELKLYSNSQEIKIGETLALDVKLISSKNGEISVDDALYEVIGDIDAIDITGNILTAISKGFVSIVAKYDGLDSNEISINIVDENEYLTDPYENVTKEEFYSNYQEATSYLDAYYRTLHGFMSGSIDEQDQKPSIASYQPIEDDLYLKNSSMNYSSDGNIYYVVDAYGKIVNQIYKGAAYVTLEEVAAYVFAFGDVPANYISKKSADPKESIWGEYLRLNHSKFSGNTSKYKYEPSLPRISGDGGDLTYYEIDLGTTGTDCDPSYETLPYNDGDSIERGAARIVYARYDANRNNIIDINEKYLFYTYNHYNDFQEYLNYEGGWGKMFGNITGGGSLSSNIDYNPTPYVLVILKDFQTEEVINLISFDNLYFDVVYYYKKENLYI